MRYYSDHGLKVRLFRECSCKCRSYCCGMLERDFRRFQTVSYRHNLLSGCTVSQDPNDQLVELKTGTQMTLVHLAVRFILLWHLKHEQRLLKRYRNRLQRHGSLHLTAGTGCSFCNSDRIFKVLKLVTHPHHHQGGGRRRHALLRLTAGKLFIAI